MRKPFIIPFNDNSTPFPPTHYADSEGLLAIGGNLSPQRLIMAYQQGVFPWDKIQQYLLWYSPDPRMVLFPQEFKISRSLKKNIKNSGYYVTADKAFLAVIKNCAVIKRNDQNSTWIRADFIDAYYRLHRLGLAHSIETWSSDQLIGGLYGVNIGRIFCGESMFSQQANASKIALAYLSKTLKQWNFDLIDCQVYTEHLASLGAREIKRADFLAYLHAQPLKRYSWQQKFGTQANYYEEGLL